MTFLRTPRRCHLSMVGSRFFFDRIIICHVKLLQQSDNIFIFEFPTNSIESKLFDGIQHAILIYKLISTFLRVLIVFRACMHY